MKNISKYFALALLFFLTVFCSSEVCAQVPATLNYQGYLTDSLGQPVSGSKSIVFSLYDVASGGTAFWSETQTVQVTNGRFSVVLGKATPLNPDQFAGTTFIGIKVGSDAEMAPRQQFTSVAYAFQAYLGGIPKGGIIMWSGSIASIPAGWALCDGTNGTPNLKDKFVIGAGSTTYPVNASGGSTKHDLRHTHPLKAHTHATKGHTLSIDEMPAHNHNLDSYQYLLRYTGSGTTADTDSTSNEPDLKNKGAIQSRGGNQPHHHGETETQSGGPGATDDGGSQEMNIMPPYYALAFIMKL